MFYYIFCEYTHNFFLWIQQWKHIVGVLSFADLFLYYVIYIFVLWFAIGRFILNENAYTLKSCFGIQNATVYIAQQFCNMNSF